MFTVLIVEDNKLINQSIMEMVDWGNLSIVVAGSAYDGAQGLKMGLELRPDFIITDVDMPRMNGIEMIREILKTLPDTKSVFISGFDDFQFIKNAMDLRAYRYILKPIVFEELTETMRALSMEKTETLRKDKLLAQLTNEASGEASKPQAQLFTNLIDNEIPENEIATHNSANKRYMNIVGDIKRMIDAQYSSSMSIEEMIKDLYISPSHANYIFKQQTGKSIFNYVIEVRMEEAKRLLKDSYCKVYEVAQRVGYTNRSYFTLAFKEYTGFTPKQYAGL